MSIDTDTYIYLDYAATSPLCQEAYDAMQDHMKCGREGAGLANPNSLHTPGRDAFRAMERARREFMKCIGAARPDEIIFTGGATEADNAAIFGITRALVEKARQTGKKNFKPHVITSSIEHDAVLHAFDYLARIGFEVTYLTPNRDGFIEAEKFEKAIKDNTIFASIQMANSEVGSIQPIKQMSEIAHAHDVVFHTDATQALGKVVIDAEDLGIDAASFSAHKIAGPRGVGALYLRNKTPFEPYIFGGGQENGRRSGTQNVCGIVGFAAAAKSACEGVEDESARLMAMRDKLYADLQKFDAIEASVDVEAGSEDYLSNIVNVLTDGIESESAVLRFDHLGFAVSGGSACSSHSLEPSHVLTSMGISPDKAHTELRISFGRYTTIDDINAFLKAVANVLDWNE